MESSTAQFKVKFQVDGRGGWRFSIGRALRKFATVIDRRHSFAVDIDTIPWIGQKRERECIDYGFNAMNQAIVNETRAETLEETMQILHGELYQKP